MALSSSGLPLGSGVGGQIGAKEGQVVRTLNVIKSENEEEEEIANPDEAGRSFSYPVPAQNILK